MFRGFVVAILLLLPSPVLAQVAASGRNALDAIPHIFGPGVISTAGFEFNASFDLDGKTVYFSKSDPVFQHITIVRSRLKNGRWLTPEVVPFSGVWKDTDPFIAPDGKRMFFTSNRPTDNSGVARKDYDIWYVERVGVSEWGVPHHVGAPINSHNNESYPSVASDGTLYFDSTRPDHPGSHIFRARLTNGEYAPPEVLSFAGQANDLDGTIAADQSFIVFISRDRNSMGAGDVYVSFSRADGSWTTPRNLGAPISSPFHEIATGLSRDNRTLYFASNRIDAASTRSVRANYTQIELEQRSIQNGLLNIYEVDISNLKNLASDVR